MQRDVSGVGPWVEVGYGNLIGVHSHFSLLQLYWAHAPDLPEHGPLLSAWLVHLAVDSQPSLSPNSELAKPLPGFILSQCRGTGTQSSVASLYCCRRLGHARKLDLVTFGADTLVLRAVAPEGHRTSEGLGRCHPGALTGVDCPMCRAEAGLPRVQGWVWGSVEVPGKGRKLSCAQSWPLAHTGVAAGVGESHLIPASVGYVLGLYMYACVHVQSCVCGV